MLIIRSDSIETTIEGGISKIVHELDLKNFLNQLDEIVVVSKYNGHSSIFYMVEPKSLKLIPSEIELSISKNTDFHEITIHSKTLQKDVFLYTKQKGHFSDNFFDLIPYEPKIIRFYSQEDTINDIYHKSLNNFIR